MGRRIDGLQVMNIGVVAPIVIGFVAYEAMNAYASQGLDIASYHIMADTIKNYTGWVVLSGLGATAFSELADFV
jgi:hypothetical protein